MSIRVRARLTAAGALASLCCAGCSGCGGPRFRYSADLPPQSGLHVAQLARVAPRGLQEATTRLVCSGALALIAATEL